jgi:hypothetical protein
MMQPVVLLLCFFALLCVPGAGNLTVEVHTEQACNLFARPILIAFTEDRYTLKAENLHPKRDAVYTSDFQLVSHPLTLAYRGGYDLYILNQQWLL